MCACVHVCVCEHVVECIPSPHILCAQLWTADTDQGAIPRVLYGDDGTDGHFLKAHRRYVDRGLITPPRNEPSDTAVHAPLDEGSINISSPFLGFAPKHRNAALHDQRHHVRVGGARRGRPFDPVGGQNEASQPPPAVVQKTVQPTDAQLNTQNKQINKNNYVPRQQVVAVWVILILLFSFPPRAAEIGKSWDVRRWRCFCSRTCSCGRPTLSSSRSHPSVSVPPSCH